MKQRLTNEQVQSLLPGQKEILKEFWVPQIGDWCYNLKGNTELLVTSEDIIKIRRKDGGYLFLPTIGQMVGLIQKLRDYSSQQRWGYCHDLTLKQWSAHDPWEIGFIMADGQYKKKNCIDRNLCDVLFIALKLLLSQACENLIGGCTNEPMKNKPK